MKIKDFGKYVWFSYIGSNNHYSFSTYQDSETGQIVGYVMGYDKHGNPIYKNWEFNADSRTQIRVSETEHDKSPEKKLAVEFLRRSPECAGSVNGYYQLNGADKKQLLVYFTEVNEKKTAEDAVSARKLVIDAQKAALDLKGIELEEMAAVIGVFESEPSLMTHKVLDYSSNYPKKFLELLGDPKRKVLATIRRGINASVLTEDGKMIKWEGKLIGADEDEAVSNLLKDDKLRKAIELNIQKFG